MHSIIKKTTTGYVRYILAVGVLLAVSLGVVYLVNNLISSASHAAPIPTLTIQAGPTVGGTTTELPLALQGKTIAQTSSGFYHSPILTSDGSLYSWGANWSGQLGNGTTADSSIPVAISPLPYPSLTGITFDSVPVTSFEILPNGNVSMVAPAHTAGPVDVVFTYADGRTTTIQNGFTYADAATDGGTVDPETPTTQEDSTTPTAPDSGVARHDSVALTVLTMAVSVLLVGIGGVVAYQAGRSR